MTLLDRWIETEIKVLQSLRIAEARHRDATINQSIVAKQKFVLKQQL
ncbi:MAG: hypothetical protein SGI77_25270 [Pirellulaceae bacterium]|nr:hypothetical protein [Pirellulaceae bacterium]